MSCIVQYLSGEILCPPPRFNFASSILIHSSMSCALFSLDLARSPDTLVDVCCLPLSVPRSAFVSCISFLLSDVPEMPSQSL